jgi:heterodisulfide reductase subunit A
MDIDTMILATGQTVDKSKLPGKIDYSKSGTVNADPVTFQTNIKGVFAGGDVVSGPATVIEAVAAGKEAAISIDRYLQGIDLKEGRPPEKERVKDVPKQGVAKKPRAVMPLLSAAERIKNYNEVEAGFDEKTAVEEANRCLNCAVCSECLECVTACERKAVHHEMKEEIVEVKVGNIILATGYREFDPSVMKKYGYGRLDNVITGLEFERIVNSAGPTSGKILLKNGEEPKRVAIIHCVGSRDINHHEYCSSVCCMYSLKFSHLLREHLPKAEVYEFYIDIRAPRKGFEEFYNRILKEGTILYRGRPGEITDVAETPYERGKLIVKFENSLIGERERLPVDMVILSAALEPQKDAREVGRIFNISCGVGDFFIERHPKLDPVATMTEGVFIAGCCESPKDIRDSVAQASAAAARILALISKGMVETEATIAEINEDQCSGCRICNLLCPYSAITYIEDKKVSRINDAICKGCGACAAACPSAAIKHKHYTSEEIMAQIEGILV